MEIEQVWQYGKELGQDFFSPFICNVEYYGEGHYLVHSGGIGWDHGWASEQLGAFIKLGDEGYDINSKTVELKDDVVMYYLEVDGNFYRAEKLTPYHDGDNAPFGDGKLLGQLEVTPDFGTIPDLEETSEVVDAWNQIRIEEDEDRLVFHGRFQRGQLAMVIMDNGSEKKGYFINTAAVSYLAMCSGAFLEDDDRVIKMNISKSSLPAGKCEVKVLVEDRIFQTGVVICN